MKSSLRVRTTSDTSVRHNRVCEDSPASTQRLLRLYYDPVSDAVLTPQKFRVSSCIRAIDQCFHVTCSSAIFIRGTVRNCVPGLGLLVNLTSLTHEIERSAEKLETTKTT